jgi:hypothetical protein
MSVINLTNLQLDTMKNGKIHTTIQVKKAEVFTTISLLMSCMIEIDVSVNFHQPKLVKCDPA